MSYKEKNITCTAVYISVAECSATGRFTDELSIICNTAESICVEKSITRKSGSSCTEWGMICNTSASSCAGWGMTCNTTVSSCGDWGMACGMNASICVSWNVTSAETEDGGGEWDIVTNDFRMYFQIINFVFICQIIDLFGTGTNIVNIICFVKQGLKDPVNISFLGLTISDLLSLLTLVWQNISANPLLYETDIPFDPEQTAYLTGGTPHLAFTRVTGWITAFITLERCFCITHPLKVKNVFTRKRVIIIISSIYIIILVSNLAPSYYTIPFVMTKHPYLNRSWIGLEFTQYRRPIERYAFAINSIFGPFCAFAIVVIATVILVFKLRSKTNWRKKSTAPGKSDVISNRDRSVSKMVVMISTIFIICYIPVCIIFIGMIVVPKLSIDGTFGNAFVIVFSFAYILESINASSNIFVYYRASTRYQTVLRQIFWKCRSPGSKISTNGSKASHLTKSTVI